MRFGKQRQVDDLIDKHFWEGFWSRMQGGSRSERRLSYQYAPAWYDDVANIAVLAGWDAADAMLSRLAKIEASGHEYFGIGSAPKIPASVYAECYGAARISAVAGWSS